jgi:hypothetical protein
MSAIANAFFPILDFAVLRPVTTKPSSRSGYVNVIESDGSVLSIQPDGSQQTRPAGTDAAFEQARICGSWIVYQPEAPTGKLFAIPFWDVT